jgi:hypothetical protein
MASIMTAYPSLPHQAPSPWPGHRGGCCAWGVNTSRRGLRLRSAAHEGWRCDSARWQDMQWQETLGVLMRPALWRAWPFDSFPLPFPLSLPLPLAPLDFDRALDFDRERERRVEEALSRGLPAGGSKSVLQPMKPRCAFWLPRLICLVISCQLLVSTKKPTRKATLLVSSSSSSLFQIVHGWKPPTFCSPPRSCVLRMACSSPTKGATLYFLPGRLSGS